MREIKFRAWDTEAEYMFYSDGTEDTYSFEFVDGKLRGLAIRPPEYLSSDPMEPPQSYCEDYPVMQSTGLCDKNGKEVWQGMGGIHPNLGKYVVRLGLYSNPDGKEHCGFYIEWQDKYQRETLTPRLPLWLTQNEMLFDMNIHENPELLK